MKAKVLSVYDEGSLPGTSLIGAKGFSVIVDVDGERTLFDTGRRGAYLKHNMDELEIGADSIDRIVLSHAHTDHTGGLPAFLERRTEKIDVLATPDIDGTHKEDLFGLIPMNRAGMPKMPDNEKEKMNLIKINNWTQLSENLFMTGIPEGAGSVKGAVQENSLVLMTENGPAAICGCCHNGPASLMEIIEERTERKVSAFVGGMHLVRSKRNYVHELACTLKDNGRPMLYLNHCSGQTQRTYLREILGMDGVKDLYVGTEIHFDI
ncbi:MAG: MBL fold metallo-hydrolase [Methanomassiliicoccaceae archaeon]|nr:MBL fold metallo-hydrolase [Methanomassiliicoccaceae archaeon]